MTTRRVDLYHRLKSCISLGSRLLTVINLEKQWITRITYETYLMIIGYSHDRKIFKRHGHFYDYRGKTWVRRFIRKRLTIVLVVWLA